MRAPAFPALFTLCAALAACGGGGGGGTPLAPTPLVPASAAPAPIPSPPDAEVVVDDRAATVATAPAINRRVLGTNVQWTDGCDGLLQTGSSAWNEVALARAVNLAPAAIRFPGGGQADAYHWQAGIDTGSGRGTCMHVFTDAMQTVWFGHGEFTELCRRTGAEPLITVNVLTGTPAESAAWVAYANAAGRMRVRDWEIGNEPYLLWDRHPAWTRSAAEFAALYDQHAAAMIAADPGIRVLLPLLTPHLASLVPEERRGWNATVLAAIAQRVDVVAIHNAYLPFYYPHDRVPGDTEMLTAILAGAPAVAADLDRLRAELTARGIAAPFALTEHNTLVTLFGTIPIPRSDGATASLAGAVYTADLVCMLAARADVDSAHHWSLIGNWLFGAVHPDGRVRPAHRVLEALGRVLVGRRLPLAVSSPTAAVAAFGALPAQTAMPLVAGLACLDGDTLRTVLINRSPTRALSIRLTRRGSVTGIATARALDAADPLAHYEQAADAPDWRDLALGADGDGLRLSLPAHAVVIVEQAPAPTAIASAR